MSESAVCFGVKINVTETTEDDKKAAKWKIYGVYLLSLCVTTFVSCFFSLTWSYVTFYKNDQLTIASMTNKPTLVIFGGIFTLITSVYFAFFFAVSTEYALNHWTENTRFEGFKNSCGWNYKIIHLTVVLILPMVFNYLLRQITSRTISSIASAIASGFTDEKIKEIADKVVNRIKEKMASEVLNVTASGIANVTTGGL